MSTSAAHRSVTFGTAAEAYERFRLGYPDEVVDRTLAYAGREVTTAVEVGAGTGKATRAFASRGVRVAALEPDQDMFSVLRRETVGMPVEPVRSALGAYAGPRVDLVYAAGSWPAADARARWRHTADLLVDDGAVAMFAMPIRIADPELQAAVEAGGPALEAVPMPGDELVASDLFRDVEEHLLAREVVLPRREYIGALSTLSSYLGLPLDERQDVLRRIARVVPAQVRLDVSVRLFLARRS